MNVECITWINVLGQEYLVRLSDACPMGHLSVLVESQGPEGLQFDIDLTVTQAEDLVEALSLLIARRKE